MPPKLQPKEDRKTLVSKMQNTNRCLDELLEEFEVIYAAKPQLARLQTIFAEVESKYRTLRKQIAHIADKLIEEGAEDEEVQTYWSQGGKAKTAYLNAAQRFAQYESEYCEKTEDNSLQEMTAAITKMAKALESKQNQGVLEKLPVPSWDGNRRTYATFKKEFQHWMEKYKQDGEEQLQRFRKAMPKGWWLDQIKTCKSIEQAWKILDFEFEDKRKLMDSLLAEINNLKPTKRDSKSLTAYSATLRRYVSDMEDNGCPVTGASESPFFMSQLLSKLDPKDNIEYGREMRRQKSEETVLTLIEWLHQEASLRSRGKTDDKVENKTDRNKGFAFQRKADPHAVERSQAEDDCVLGCTAKHLLQACPTFQSSSVSQRWQIVKQNQRCRKCLRPHHTNDCSKADGTSCDKCKKNHHRLLHNEKRENPNQSGSSVSASSSTDKSPATSNNNSLVNTQDQGDEKNVAGLCPVQTIHVLDVDGVPESLLAMVDSGSNTSLLSKNAAKRLGLKGTQTHLTMNLAGGSSRSEDSELLEITLMPTNDHSIKKTISVFTVQRPCSNAKTVSKAAVEEYEHLKSVSDKLHLSGGTVDLLIGTDFVDAFIDIHTLSGKAGEPIAKRNCFGWYSLGQFSSATATATIQSVDVGTVSIAEDIRNLIHQDQLGVKPTELCTCTEEVLRENKFVKSLAESTTLVDGRIQVRLPWKETGPPKQSNHDIAYRRLLSSERTFNKRDCFDVVEEEIKKLVEQEFVAEVPVDQIDHNQPEWYLPVQVVFTPDKSTKVRLVFDSSCKGHDGLSLNDHLEKGPNYINNLCDVLMAWRWDSVAFSGDIRKMFNQILVHPDDQIYHRFLWRKNPNDPPTVYQWLRLSFGDKPAPDIATNEINTLANISEEQFSEAAKELKEHAYVDDIGGSKETESQVKKVINDIDTILAKGQFKIKNWHSNSKSIDPSNEEQFVDLLGHRWNKEADTFTFKRNEIKSLQQNLTKRHCLASVAQLWDPIGLVSPVTVKFRIDLQELWSSGFRWDDVLPNSSQQKWKENLEMMNHLLTFEFDRQLKPVNSYGLPEIHGFSDGGQLAYGAVVFLRWKLEDESYKCVSIMIKPFVAPLKKKSIPRLELLGCLALTRIYKSLTEALDFANISDCRKTFWVDSSTALSWIKTPPKEFIPFVSARVAEIQETVNVDHFKYIRSKSNPADALTRGIKPEDLKSWLEVPVFLRQPESEWPRFQDTPESKTEDAAETKKEKKPTKKKDARVDHSEISEVHSAETKKTADNSILSQLLESCSTFKKIRKTLAFVLRFIQRALKKSGNEGSLTVQELKDAEKVLFRLTQQNLETDKLDKSIIAKEDEDGIVRAHGRLENIRTLPADVRNPIILPRKHPLVKLLVLHLHNKRRHCGYKSLVHEIRKRFWIVGVRSIAKFLTRMCVTCRKLREKPLEQLMGQIPRLRVAEGCPVFTNTALDMFGPVHVKLNRRTLKEAQIIIFTCMTARAVHLELVTDKSADCFLMSFRRFASLRGHPSTCWSDQGTNFVGAQEYLNEIKQSWNMESIKDTLAQEFNCDFKWEWNVPTASHQNGVVESLIKSVRQALSPTCKNQSFTEEQWRTFLAEVVNGRPLYPSSENIWETPPITPNDILLGQHHSVPQPVPEERVNPRDLTKSTQKRVQEFWTCWMKYFAPTLLPRNKWYRVRENVQIGDLVLQVDPNHRRAQWKMAVIIDTYPGEDGLVRKVRIRTQTGEYDRPIHKLCLIATHEELEQ